MTTQAIITNRRHFVASTSLAIAGLTRRATAAAAIDWHDVQEWGVEGKGWSAEETEKYFDRLPRRAKGKVRDAVWSLSRHSAGMLTRFVTDAREISVHYKVSSSSLAMNHMPATGVSGVDLYGEDDEGVPHWLAVARPSKQETQAKLVGGLTGKRTYWAYLPLYNGTEFLKIGVPQGSSFEPVAPRTQKPMVFYGTSITHGACASRPGMPHPAILGRRLGRPVINLGFSGNGRMEHAVGEFLVELDPCVYVIDCLPNMRAAEVAARTEPLVTQLREARPGVPILLVEDRTYANARFLSSLQDRHASSRAQLRKAFEKLQARGVTNLHYLPGETLLGSDGEDTTDGSHPSDLGFYRQANAFTPILKRILQP